MPAYHYTCDSCGHELDTLKRMADAAEPEVCPAEGCGQPMRRTWEPNGFRIAGGTPKFHHRKVAR